MCWGNGDAGTEWRPGIQASTALSRTAPARERRWSWAAGSPSLGPGPAAAISRYLLSALPFLHPCPSLSHLIDSPLNKQDFQSQIARGPQCSAGEVGDKEFPVHPPCGGGAQLGLAWSPPAPGRARKEQIL